MVASFHFAHHALLGLRDRRRQALGDVEAGGIQDASLLGDPTADLLVFDPDADRRAVQPVMDRWPG